jgi:hypothetical protein
VAYMNKCPESPLSPSTSSPVRCSLALHLEHSSSPNIIIAIIPPGGKVLVSGANGYVACWIVRCLLEKGYAVRGAVRSLDKGRHLQDLFKSFGERFELAVVSDITKASDYVILFKLPALIINLLV